MTDLYEIAQNESKKDLYQDLFKSGGETVFNERKVKCQKRVSM